MRSNSPAGKSCCSRDYAKVSARPCCSCQPPRVPLTKPRSKSAPRWSRKKGCSLSSYRGLVAREKSHRGSDGSFCLPSPRERSPSSLDDERAHCQNNRKGLRSARRILNETRTRCAPRHEYTLKCSRDIEIMLHAQEILNLKKRLNDIYVRHTGQPLKKIEDAL